jgi:SAM-dependent methyltransferase
MSENDRGIQLESTEDARALWEFFRASEYQRTKLGKWLPWIAPPSPRRRNLAMMLHLTREPSCLNTLVRWFIMGLPVEEETARATIPKEILALLAKSGLVSAGNGRIGPAVLLMPLGDVLAACDCAPTSNPRPDLVIGPGAPTQLLSQFMVSEKVQSALDLCCGPGIHAIQMTLLSEKVVAADLSSRALQFAQFNARLNGIKGIEFVQGDLLEPLQGRSFDRIIANPPFYMLPANDILYRDNPMELDAFVEKLIRQVPHFLNEGGYYQTILEWAEIEGQPWQDRVSEWVSGSGCDVWLIKDYSQIPTQYCYTKMHTVDQISLEHDIETLDAWTGYYSRKKVVGMHGGVLAMRKRSGRKNWIEMEEYSINAEAPFGDLVKAVFAGHDLVADAGDDGILAIRPRLSPHTRLEQVMKSSEDGWAAPFMELKLDQGLRITCGLDGQVAVFLSQCTGKRALGELIDSILPAGADRQKARASCIGVARRLLQRGFLLTE